MKNQPRKHAYVVRKKFARRAIVLADSDFHALTVAEQTGIHVAGGWVDIHPIPDAERPVWLDRLCWLNIAGRVFVPRWFRPQPSLTLPEESTNQ